MQMIGVVVMQDKHAAQSSRVVRLLVLLLLVLLIPLNQPVVALAHDTNVTVLDRSASISAETDDEDALVAMGYTVYITKSGTKYHRDGCRSLWNSRIPIDVNAARARGYTPCSVCDPDDYYEPEPEPEPEPKPQPEPEPETELESKPETKLEPTLELKLEPEPAYGRFPDVGQSHWAGAVIERACDLGLVNGYSNGEFGPDDNVTRGQAAVIIWNLAGKPAPEPGARSFSDVSSGTYYYSAVKWASSADVINGYAGTNNFGPEDDVTREQLAVMLWKYASYENGSMVLGGYTYYNDMSDGNRVSDYAQDGVGWCFRKNILSGSNGQISPQGKASRAMLAKMVVGVKNLVWYD